MADKRLNQINALATNRGSFYNIFKSKPELMELFDACKTFEEDKGLFSSGLIVNTDESNDAELG